MNLALITANGWCAIRFPVSAVSSPGSSGLISPSSCSSFCSLFSRFFRIDITIFMFHDVFRFQCVLSIPLLSLALPKSTSWHICFFLLITIRLDLLIWIGQSNFITKSLRILSCIFWDQIWSVDMLFVCIVTIYLLVQFPVDHFPYPVMLALILFLYPVYCICL